MAKKRKYRVSKKTNTGFSDQPINGMTFEKHGAVLQRGHNTVYTSVPHLCVHHSPAGFEYGYAGSGPSDLALNILQAALNHQGYEGAWVETWDGSGVFELAWMLHKDFETEFIAPMPTNGGRIPLDLILDWIAFKSSGVVLAAELPA